MTAIIRKSTRASGAVDRFCLLTGPKRTRIDLGGVDLVWGLQMKKNEVLFVQLSISKENRQNDGNSLDIDACVRGCRYILPLDLSKTDKN